MASADRLAALLAAALLALPAAAAAVPPGAVDDLVNPPPHAGNCLADRELLYCADATASAGVSCSMNATHYSCTLTASWSAKAWTSGPWAGQLSAPKTLDYSLCDGISCTQVPDIVGASCSWTWMGGDCSRGGSFAATFAGPYVGCVEAYVSVIAGANARLPVGSGPSVAQDQATALDSLSTC